MFQCNQNEEEEGDEDPIITMLCDVMMMMSGCLLKINKKFTNAFCLLLFFPLIR